MVQMLRMYANKELHYPTSYEVVQNPVAGKIKIRFRAESGEILECRPEDAMPFTGRFISEIPLYVGDILRFKHGGITMYGVIRAKEDHSDYVIQTCCHTDNVTLDFCLSSCSTLLCGNVHETPNATRMLLDVIVDVHTQPQSAAAVPEIVNITDIDFDDDMSCEDNANIIIYTDGCCLSNPGGDGGWAYVRIEDGITHAHSGYLPETTNNIAELTAVIEALKSVEGKKRNITIHSDSQYVIKAFNDGWLKNWKKYGWVTSSGDAVKNIGLWTELDVLSRKHNCTWVWVKGHANNRYNEMCDKMAGQAALTHSPIEH